MEIGLVKSESCTIKLVLKGATSKEAMFFFPARLAHGFATGSSQGVEIVVVQFTELKNP